MSTKVIKAPRLITGKVVSAKKMNSTIVVAVVRQTAHPLYGKTITKTTKFYAHDPDNRCNEGDVVSIRPTRPISKLKCWHLNEIIEQSTDVASS
jgi:small subunit ribosomal protein S17